jgi:hypothetical protein
MFRKYSFWLKVAATFQILTAAIHSLSFLSRPQPANETEEQLFHLMYTYKRDLGAGFQPTTADLFKALSACFALAYLLGGLVNLYLLYKKAGPSLIKGITVIQLIIFGAGFVLMLTLTFLPPIILTTFVFLFLLPAFFLNRRSA